MARSFRCQFPFRARSVTMTLASEASLLAGSSKTFLVDVCFALARCILTPTFDAALTHASEAGDRYSVKASRAQRHTCRVAVSPSQTSFYFTAGSERRSDTRANIATSRMLQTSTLFTAGYRLERLSRAATDSFRTFLGHTITHT